MPDPEYLAYEIHLLMAQAIEAWPPKTWAQVLQENPNHAGGLAQLAQAEQQAALRS